MVITLVGSEGGQLAHVEAGSFNETVLKKRGWRPLEKLAVAEIRKLAPKGVKLPPNAKAPTLAAAVTAALLAPKD